MVNSVDVLDEVDHTAAVAKLVVVPRDKLDEVVVQGDAGLGIKDRAVVIADEIGRDHFVLGVAEDALELVLRGAPHRRLDLLVLGRPGQAHSQVDHRDVGGRHTERHAGQLAVQLRDDLADGLGGARRRRYDVGGGGAASPPVLARRTVHGLLGGRVRVNRGHQALDDAELIVDDLGQRSQAVGGARGVAEHRVGRVEGPLVDTADIHGRVGRRGGDDHTLGASLDVRLALVDGGEHTGGLHDVLSARRSPRYVDRVLPFILN